MENVRNVNIIRNFVALTAVKLVVKYMQLYVGNEGSVVQWVLVLNPIKGFCSLLEQETTLLSSGWFQERLT